MGKCLDNGFTDTGSRRWVLASDEVTINDNLLLLKCQSLWRKPHLKDYTDRPWFVCLDVISSELLDLVFQQERHILITGSKC